MPGSWPRDPLLERAADELRKELRALRYGSSDDYELVLAVDPPHRAALENIARTMGVPLTFAGRFVAGSGIVEIGEDGIKRPLDSKGWDHFAER